MNKTLATMFTATAMALSIALVGCGSKTETATQEPAAQEQAQTQEQAAPKQEAAQAPAQEQTTATEQAPAPSTSSSQISMDDAKRIALQDAGVAEQDTTQMDVDLDTDNGVTKYEVGFHVGTTEYDYDIDPVTGAIIGKSVEADDD